MKDGKTGSTVPHHRASVGAEGHFDRNNFGLLQHHRTRNFVLTTLLGLSDVSLSAVALSSYISIKKMLIPVWREPACHAVCVNSAPPSTFGIN